MPLLLVLEIDGASGGHLKGPGWILHHHEIGAAARLLEPARPADKDEYPSSDTRGGIQLRICKRGVEFIAIGCRESLYPTGQYEIGSRAGGEAEHPIRGPPTKVGRHSRGGEGGTSRGISTREGQIARPAQPKGAFDSHCGERPPQQGEGQQEDESIVRAFHR